MAENMSKQEEFVLRTLEERNIRFVRLWFTDVLGFLKSVAIAPPELKNSFEEGIGFDGSAIEGFARVTESDMLARPDAATFAVLPWRTVAPGVARMFCDIFMPDGSPSNADPRNVLKRVLRKAADMGYTCYTHPEMEFFLFKEDSETNKPIPVDSAGYFDQTPAAVQALQAVTNGRFADIAHPPAANNFPETAGAAPAESAGQRAEIRCRIRLIGICLRCIQPFMTDTQGEPAVRTTLAGKSPSLRNHKPQSAADSAAESADEGAQFPPVRPLNSRRSIRGLNGVHADSVFRSSEIARLNSCSFESRVSMQLSASASGVIGIVGLPNSRVP